MKPTYQVWTRRPGMEPIPIYEGQSTEPFTTEDPKKADELARVCTEDPSVAEAIVVESKQIASYPGVAASDGSKAKTRRFQAPS